MKMAGDCSKEKHSLGFFRTLLAAAVLFGVGCGNARAQAPIPGEYSAEKYELQERRGVMVPMGDGVQLIVDLYMPKTAEKMATILGITPYGRSTLYSTARWFARRGYVFVAADSRGRFDSEGTWDPFNPKHKTDGYDLVEWLAPQPWANGRECGVLRTWAGHNGGPLPPPRLILRRSHLGQRQPTKPPTKAVR